MSVMFVSSIVILAMGAGQTSGLTQLFENRTEDGGHNFTSALEEDFVSDIDENNNDVDKFINQEEELTPEIGEKENNEGDIEVRSKLDKTQQIKLEMEKKDGFAFNFHPSHLYSEVEEFVFSPWYFLVFSIVDRSSSLPHDISSITSEILRGLSSKLSVPSSVFFINSVTKYTSSDTFLSVNLSLVSPLIPHLHDQLCSLNKKTPFFWVRGTQVELYQVRHQNNQHIYVTGYKVMLGVVHLLCHTI